MTRISEIHGPGIPADEFADRGANVKAPTFLPYLSMTKGEMQLSLAAQRAEMLAKWYGKDAPQYRQAAQMLNNALHTGIHYGGANFIGAVPDPLQGVAKLIKSAQNYTAPASSALFYRPAGMTGIGQIIPAEQRKSECLKQARSVVEMVKCQRNFKIEQVYNDAIKNVSHHVLYHRISEYYPVPAKVSVKILLQISGIQGMAAVSHLDNSLMDGWVENGILAKNIAIGAGPADSLESSFALAPNPQAIYSDYIKKYPSAAKWTSGINGIGVVPVAAIIIGAITSALIAAKGLIEALRQEQATIKAEGFGTEAYSGKESDFLINADNPEVVTTDDSTLIYLALAALGAYAIMEA